MLVEEELPEASSKVGGPWLQQHLGQVVCPTATQPHEQLTGAGVQQGKHLPDELAFEVPAKHTSIVNVPSA